MNNDNKPTFEEIFKQNENRIHYYIHKLQINDTHREFYVEGLYAMWLAYKRYQPDQGPLSTYFNYTIRNRMIDLLRSKAREQEKTDTVVKEEQISKDDGNRFKATNLPIVSVADIPVEDQSFWKAVKSQLSENQWKWVYYSVIQEMSHKQIAELEEVSIDTVKSWGREARKKLRVSGIYEI